MNSRNKLAEMPIRPLLYTMAVPLMLSLLVQSLYNIVDSIFVARLSETALTAASLGYSIQFLMIAVGVGTEVGLNALLSRKIGEHKPEEACRAATTGLFLMLLTSLSFSIIGIFLSDTIATNMAADSELQELCKQYLSINLVYCWGIFLQTYAQRLLQAIGDTVLSMLSLIIGAVLNIILDPIMIFGLLGCPAMGVRGAAIATVIGQMAGAIAALLFNRFRNPIIHVRLKDYHFKWQDIRDIYRVGLPTIIMQAIGSIMTFVVNRILLDVSATAVAFFGIYYKLQNFLMMPINGLGQAATCTTDMEGFTSYRSKHCLVRNCHILVFSRTAAATIFCKFRNAATRHSGTKDYLHFLCDVCHYNPLRIFFLRTWKWYH